MNKFPFDELNTLEKRVFSVEGLTMSKEECEDAVLDLLIMAYVFGNDAANEMLGSEVQVNASQMESTIYRKGQTKIKPFNELVNKYMDSLDMSAIVKVAETEAHRVYNDAVLNAGIIAGAKTKTWRTQLDPRVREEHEYLEDQTVPIQDKFYTWDGYSTDYPGGFGVPELDINCRCFIEVNKA